MALIPRLIALALYCLLVFLTYTLIMQDRTHKLSTILFLCVMALTCMGYCYVPFDSSDLSRVQMAMHYYASFSLSDPEFFSEIREDGIPMTAVYFWLVAQLGNDNLLPAINAFLTYSLCFHLLTDIQKKTKSQIWIVALAFLFFMSRGLLMMTISNIKTMLSLAIIGVSIYKIMIDKKYRYFIFLFLGAQVHNTGLFATLVVLCYYFFIASKMISVKILGVILLYVLFTFGSDLFLAAQEKGSNYLESSSSGTGYFYGWEMLLSLIVIFFNLFLSKKYYKKIGLSSDGDNDVTQWIVYKPFFSFVRFLTIIDFIIIFIEFNLGYRLSWLISILDIPLLVILYSSPLFYQQDTLKQRQTTIIVSCIMLFLACCRGDLCSLKFI